jgi:hypothetical protein
MTGEVIKNWRRLLPVDISEPKKHVIQFLKLPLIGRDIPIGQRPGAAFAVILHKINSPQSRIARRQGPRTGPSLCLPAARANIGLDYFAATGSSFEKLNYNKYALIFNLVQTHTVLCVA